MREILHDREVSLWMWYIYPQLRGLGRSSMSSYYGIGSMAETDAYLKFPVLGNRLREISQSLLQLEGLSAREIFSMPDMLKLQSCMTLFNEASPDNLFGRVLEKCYGGRKDRRTLKILGTSAG